MSGISGKKREQVNFDSKKVGLFASNVLCVNPNIEEFKEILGMELKEDSKVTEYLGESKEGNTTLRVDFWLEEVKTKAKFKVTFFLEDKKRTNKTEEGDGKVKKFQYINTVGACSWADDPNNLPTWLTGREYRVANVGEEELYNFMRVWLGTLDYKDAETVLQMEWKKLMKGKLDDVRNQINGEYCTPVVALATVKTVTKEGEEEVKEYQSIYNRAFLPEYCLKFFRTTDYNKQEEQNKLKAKKSSDLKPHEKFVLQVSNSQYGCKDFYTFKDLKEYDPADNLVASDLPLDSTSADY